MELLTTERKDDFLAQAKKNMDRLIGMVVKAKRCTKGKCIPRSIKMLGVPPAIIGRRCGHASLTNFYRRNRAGHGTMARRRRRRR